VTWAIFRYRPTTLFSLKTSRATSTVGKTLLVPTPYSIKMAFLDAGIRFALVTDAEAFVRVLRTTEVHIGVPENACVTGTVQKIRQEPKKPSAEQPYISNIALREVVFFSGPLLIAFDSVSCPPEIDAIAPAVNYFGKRGSFFQFEASERRDQLDATFTWPTAQTQQVPSRCHLATLDDFGPEATFDALNSFSASAMKRDKHRNWIESMVPLGVYNVGPGFVHYRR
jgi:hypothetical protein